MRLLGRHRSVLSLQSPPAKWWWIWYVLYQTDAIIHIPCCLPFVSFGRFGSFASHLVRLRLCNIIPDNYKFTWLVSSCPRSMVIISLLISVADLERREWYMLTKYFAMISSILDFVCVRRAECYLNIMEHTSLETTLSWLLWLFFLIHMGHILEHW